MDRRDFLKKSGIGAGSMMLSMMLGQSPGLRPEAGAEELNVDRQCRIVVFGSDGLRIDFAKVLRKAGAPALSALNPAICSLSGGFSVTQPGWAAIWSAMPANFNKAYGNDNYGSMPKNIHILERLMNEFRTNDFYAVWITGKGKNIKGNIPESPHYGVYDSIVNKGFPGVYHGDKERPNEEVFHLAGRALQEAAGHDNFAAFVHFHDPDTTGHKTQDYREYLKAAGRVDAYIDALMKQLPEDTDIIYCSDHGFNFKTLGDVESSHGFSPWGMVATNADTLVADENQFGFGGRIIQAASVCQHSVGRLIYKLSGGNPHRCALWGKAYSMYGVDLI